MKKFLWGILSFVLVAVGGNLISADFSASANDSQMIINVGSAEEFVSVFSTQTTYNDENVKIVISAPLDFANVDTSVLGESKNTFMGTLDGNGNTISNLTFTSSTLYYGLIPYAKNATIENVRINGNINFQFDSANVQEIYAGVLVGYGENVIIRNCELDNTIISEEDGSVSFGSINLPIYSNLNFGFIAGKLKGNGNAENQTMPANIHDCVNYYDANVVINKYSNIAFGGLIGALENCYMLNSMNFGKITYSKISSLTSANVNAQYFGGLAGTINGSGLNIRNSMFGGEINSYEDVTGLNAKVGAIFGGAISSQPKAQNVVFDYYTQASLKPCGDEYVEAGDDATGAKLGVVSVINKTLLLDAEGKYLDQSLPGFNFNKTWLLVASRFHIQNFQIFEYTLNNVLDRSQILESALFCTSGSQNGSTIFRAKYGTQIDIRLNIKDAYQGFYNFSYMLLNNKQYTGDYAIEEITSGDKVTGYVISIEANATTAGSYSFFISQKTYDCMIAISEEAKDGAQGGVRVQSSSIQSTPSPEFHMTFAYNSDTQKVVAEGNGIYSFDHWKILYRDENGDFTGEGENFEQSSLSTVTITFGSAPFNKEFKLVAYFTDEEAIKIDFGEVNYDLIKSIKLAGEEYSGGQVQIAPSRLVQIEVVTQSDYILNVEDVEIFINGLYGENPSPYPPQAKEPVTNEAGETTYVFYIDLNYARGNIENNSLTVDFEAVEDTSNDGNDLLWLFITIPAVVVIAVGLIIFFAVRRRNGGGKSGGGKVKKEKAKSYKDFYS